MECVQRAASVQPRQSETVQVHASTCSVPPLTVQAVHRYGGSHSWHGAGSSTVSSLSTEPYRPPHLPPPPGREQSVYRFYGPRLREVFVETVPLRFGGRMTEALSSAAAHGTCGVNVYTEATGVFADFPCEEEGDLALVYSTVPWVREELQIPFGAGAEAPSLIVDDVFISWG
ncbi:hypothetical protein TraAM80_00472 [Trypanosoma rangeli]|uniref:Uncharacterized protein n=1 Tax=Trypanosoma rangeli TaxID=5698 RepID=A0A3R7MW13_TRYRA|nr:uncharacterized protein TraAM80_00472 [Trypanosoma rangeli]RNF12191.1 hypothetical protein TraAM80_00472 [Trypanosoma rangeli]|eukprot:RNF12191.1 hypothetical protein TraAM80_00472 [Trypanosoma rangeli]